MMKRCSLLLIILIFVPNSVFAISAGQFFSKSYAVVIGISEYPSSNWSDLKNAENDANEIAKYFRKEGYEVKLFLSREATKSNILGYLEDELPDKLKIGDRLVIYFSGHGDTYRNSDLGYLIPYDGVEDKRSSWISMKKIQEISKLNEVAKHQLFILDSCFGGSLASKSSKGEKEYVERHSTNIARQFISAGRENETTLAESRLPGYKQFSHYTAYLIKGLREGEADIHRDGVITLGELSAYLETAASTSRNTPVNGILVGHEFGNFIFSSPKTPSVTNSIATTDLGGPVKGSPIDQDKYDWELYSAIGTKEALLSYKDRHPSGEYVDLADAAIKLIEDEDEDEDEEKENLRKLRLASPLPENPKSIRTSNLSSSDKALAIQIWNQDIQFSTDPKDIEDYLLRYPNGPMTVQAERKLKRLKR